MNVLLISNQPLAQCGLTMVLQSLRRNIRIITAASVVQALDVIEAESDLALAIFDADMRGHSWLVSSERLACALGDIRLAVLSSSADDAAIIRSIEAGAAGYLLKSSSTQALASNIERVPDGALHVPDSDFRALELCAAGA